MQSRDTLLSLFDQSLEQINELLPEANIRDLLAIAKESLAMVTKLEEIGLGTESKPVTTVNTLIDQLRQEIHEIS